MSGYIACSSSRRRTWLSVGTVDEGLEVGTKALGAPVEMPFKASLGGEGGRFAARGGEPFTVLVTEAQGMGRDALCKELADGLLGSIRYTKKWSEIIRTRPGLVHAMMQLRGCGGVLSSNAHPDLLCSIAEVKIGQGSKIACQAPFRLAI